MSRVAIIGTAQTWREMPWDDPTLEAWTLNDAFSLGFPRIDRQFEQHPLDSFVFRSRQQPRITPDQLPPGRYLRPDGYLAWLQKQSQSIPVMLHDTPPDGWPRAERYPIERIQERFAPILQITPEWPTPYACSGPIWMLLYALDQGYTEIHFYGIHLATDKEYRDQRPNLELAIGYAIGQGVNVVIPVGSPLCKDTHVYCYEPRQNQAHDGLRWTLSEMDRERTQLTAAIAKRPWFQRAARARLHALEVRREDVGQQLGRAKYAAQLQRPEFHAALRG